MLASKIPDSSLTSRLFIALIAASLFSCIGEGLHEDIVFMHPLIYCSNALEEGCVYDVF